MQDALPAFVLRPAAPGTAMNDSAKPQTNTEAHTSSTERPSADHSSDEKLMLAFSQGSTDAFSQLFSRYKQPLTNPQSPSSCYTIFYRTQGDRHE